MDTKKIGAFLKQCRKEKNLTQEQLAEKFEVSARTVSRWETGINMPDLSVLVQLAEYYDVEMRELLDGERSQTMNKEMKETLDKVAVYEEWVKQKALKAGNLAFASMFVIGVLAIIIQMLLMVDTRLVLGEIVTVLVGGILYVAIIRVHINIMCIIFTALCSHRGKVNYALQKFLKYSVHNGLHNSDFLSYFNYD